MAVWLSLLLLTMSSSDYGKTITMLENTCINLDFELMHRWALLPAAQQSLFFISTRTIPRGMQLMGHQSGSNPTFVGLSLHISPPQTSPTHNQIYKERLKLLDLCLIHVKCDTTCIYKIVYNVISGSLSSWASKELFCVRNVFTTPQVLQMSKGDGIRWISIRSSA